MWYYPRWQSLTCAVSAVFLNDSGLIPASELRSVNGTHETRHGVAMGRLGGSVHCGGLNLDFFGSDHSFDEE